MKAVLLKSAILLLASMTFMSCGCRAKTAGGGSAHSLRVVRFGTFQQSSSKKDSLSWVVLKVEGNKALLLSLNLISAQPWDESGKNLRWDKSSIRQWLNEEFLNTAFSNEERKQIIPTVLDNSDQHGYGTPSGENTTDNVFLLSVNEFDSLVNNTQYKTASPTPLAKSEGAYTNEQGNSAWWLRSPGMTTESPSYLSSAGDLGTRAHKANEKVIGIRPAIWIKISK